MLTRIAKTETEIATGIAREIETRGTGAREAAAAAAAAEETGIATANEGGVTARARAAVGAAVLDLTNVRRKDQSATGVKVKAHRINFTFNIIHYSKEKRKTFLLTEKYVSFTYCSLS